MSFIFEDIIIGLVMGLCITFILATLYTVVPALKHQLNEWVEL